MSKTAILFPGQGAQYLNMGKDFYESYDEYKNIINCATKYVSDLTDVVYGDDSDKLNNTLYTQFAIASMELGIYDVIKNNISFDCVAGFSLGEYSALYASDVLNVKDLFEVINLRTKSMTSANVDGAMIAVLRVSYEQIETYLNELKEKLNIDCFIANYNSSEQIVLSCKNDVLNEVVEFLKDQGVRKVVPLKVSGPFHSIYYKEAASEFKESIKHIKFNNPTIDLFLNVTGKKYSAEDFYDNCEKHMYTQVNWYPLINEMIDNGVTNFIEVGPGQVLSGLMKKINKDVNIISIQSVDDLIKLEELK